jgi:hypothetical protein
MHDLVVHQRNILDSGFTVVEDIYTNDEVRSLLAEIDRTDTNQPTFRKTADLFAIRQFLKEIPAVIPMIFNGRLRLLISDLFGTGYFAVKSIYFDKPEKSNWFVAWHQDLTISVSKRQEIVGYGPWTVKQNQFAVQPPLDILKDNFTVRIHLDNADAGNGALKVVSGSHLKEVYRPETINWDIETDAICPVKAGGIMIMKPLLLHASNRTINNKKRRVIHIEFSRADLAGDLKWSEKVAI